MLISTITSNIPFIQLSLMHRITEKICKERWQHWCTKISGVKVLPTLLISTITSNMSFIQLSLMLSGYPASSQFKIVSKIGRVRSPKWRVRDDDFIVGYRRIIVDYPRIVFLSTEALQAVSAQILSFKISWQAQYLVRLEGDFACSVHCE